MRRAICSRQSSGKDECPPGAKATPGDLRLSPYFVRRVPSGRGAVSQTCATKDECPPGANEIVARFLLAQVISQVVQLRPNPRSVPLLREAMLVNTSRNMI